MNSRRRIRDLMVHSFLAYGNATNMPIERGFSVNSRFGRHASKCVSMLQIQLSGTGAGILIQAVMRQK